MAETVGLSISSNLRRDARIVGLLFASTTSMIGSGWLFGAFHASRIAGPLSVWSWVVGGAIIMLIALCFAELAVLFPRSGALVHMSHASHGASLGRIWGWMLFLAYVPVPPVEAEAIVTYANNYLPYFIKPDNSGLLTVTGFIVCAVLLGVLGVLNLLAVRILLNFNSAITWWKIAVPVLTVIVLIVASTHWNVWASDPNGYHFSDIFTALPAAGIVFSYLGFRTAIDLGGESSDPSRHIPVAVIGSVLLSAAVYILLQIAFLMALRPSDLAHGWANLSFTGQAGPFAGLAATLGIGWMATLLYIDAYISPGGTGLMYLTGGSRILYANGEMQAGPRWLTRLNEAGAPWFAVLVMWIVGILFLLPFPAWQLMVKYITSITVLTYGLGPIVLLVLRRNQPALRRPFRLWGAEILAPVAFVCSNWIIYWTGFKTNSFLFALIATGFGLYAAHHHFVARRSLEEFGWRYIAWLVPWFGGMWALSGLGDVDGGLGVLSFWPGVFLVAVWSLVVIAFAVGSALPAAETAELMLRIESAEAGSAPRLQGGRR
jgi:amino acid transporter